MKLFKLILPLSLLLNITACGGGSDSESNETSSDDTSSASVEAELSTTSKVKIMPLGDSITQSESGRPSYRYWLWNSLESEGYNVDFVGGERAGNGGPNSPSNFDLDHEGHWDWSTQDIANRSEGYAASHSPDIILLHLGTNDMFRGVPVDNALNNISKIISDFRVVNPNVFVLLAKPIPSNRTSDRIEYLGNILEQASPSLSTSSSPVIMVDQFSGFSVARDTFDGVHPDESGEQIMASKWLAALRNLL